MAHSLEVREPLMDHPLVEWMSSLPPDFKLRNGEGKVLLKRALKPYLPPEILYRPKMGFAVPLARWFRGPLRQSVRDAVLGPVLAETGWFHAAFLRRLVEDHQAGLHDYSAPLWTLLMFESFLRNVMGARGISEARAVAD
jgi:asparagine synthase (glutamine-hydrolysing)